MPRYVALDSWRGIAACLVALYHFNAVSHVYDLPVLRHAWLFVDLFFVLSGFVIAANYQERLLAGYGAGRFLLLRLGRLYPLHFVMLALFVACKALLLIPALAPISTSAAAPFSTPNEAPGTILANLLLVQSLHLYDFHTWNAQSWSISAEFYTYVVFVACLLALRRHAWIALLAALLGAPLLIGVLSDRNLATDYDWGLLRSIYGFAVGVAIWNAHARWRAPLGRWLSGSAAEWGAVILMCAFVSVAGKSVLSLAAPYVFGLVVLVFAFESGSASAILRLRPLAFLGIVSYSIYMIHVFILKRFMDAGRVLEKLWQVDAFTRREVYGQEVAFLGIEPWHGDLATLAYLAVVFAVSYFSYRWLEKPARDWVRNRVGRRAAAPAAVLGMKPG
jgi:peptidoglycan/LPS O-acetylase OafA/YrhL